MQRTLKKRALAYVRRHPYQTATQIANALRANVSSVSALLYKATRGPTGIARCGGRAFYCNGFKGWKYYAPVEARAVTP